MSELKESINKYTIQKPLTIFQTLQIRKAHNINKNRIDQQNPKL